MRLTQRLSANTCHSTDRKQSETLQKGKASGCGVQDENNNNGWHSFGADAGAPAQLLQAHALLTNSKCIGDDCTG